MDMEGDFYYQKAYNLVYKEFFKDRIKAKLWMDTENPSLGNISPNDMIEFGRGEKLITFIMDSLARSKPE